MGIFPGWDLLLVGGNPWALPLSKTLEPKLHYTIGSFSSNSHYMTRIGLILYILIIIDTTDIDVSIITSYSWSTRRFIHRVAKEWEFPSHFHMDGIGRYLILWEFLWEIL